MMSSTTLKRAMRLALGSGACLLLLMTSCKPTEQNYRQAYEKTVSARTDMAQDTTVYGDIRRRNSHEIGNVAAGSRQAQVLSAFVKITDNGGGEPSDLRKYCVVAGQFKQVFNARSMRERLAANGYPDAFVMQTGEPYYYVVAASYDDDKAAVDMLQKLASDQSLKLKEPMPLLLQPAQRR